MEFWVASYPRSGNTFLRIMLRNRFGVVSVARRSKAGDSPTLPGTQYFDPSFRDGRAVVGVEGEKTHRVPPADDTRPAVYLVRDGRDALVSYAHHALIYARECRPEEITATRLQATLRGLILQRWSAYRTWSQNVDAWTERASTQVIRYEDLIADPAGVTGRVVAGLGLNLPVLSETVPTFAELKAVEPQFFRRGTQGGWIELFTPELLDLFWEHNGATMKRLGYGEAPGRVAA